MKRDKGLKRLILDIRKSKTAAEERKIIEQEKANIRGDIGNIKLKDFYKCLNVSKLILMDMLGHDSSFGYFECIKLACSENFTHKRIGYLGISCLCTKTSDILLLCTCQIKKDLNSDNPQIISVALLAGASIGNSDILMALQPDILMLFNHREIYIRCRAIGAAISLVRACPETIGDVLGQINETMMESSGTVFRSIIVLFTEILQISSSYKESLSYYLNLTCTHLNRIIQHKGVEGVLDPMTIVYLLKFLRYYAHEVSGDSERSFLEISKNITASTKNSVKYQIASVFMRCKNVSLTRLGNNIMQSFLNSPSSNLKFCGLKLCNKIAEWNPGKVTVNLDLQGHLSDANHEVRDLALNLSFRLLNQENVQIMLKSYLNCLMSVDIKLHQSIVEKISDALAIFEVDPIWYLDTVIRVAVLANQVPESMIFNCVNLIRNHVEIQEYSAKKLFYAMNSGFKQESLMNLAFWAIGEYPESLDAAELDKFIENFINETYQTLNIFYITNMIFKIGMKRPEIKSSCTYALNHFSFYEDLEIQQRACEYLVILGDYSTTVFKDLLTQNQIKP